MKHRKRLLVATALALTLVTALLAQTQETVSASNNQVIFDGPAGMVVSDGHLWVVNATGNSVIELNSANGSLIKLIRSTADHFDGPETIASSGTDLWVVNNLGNSVTELNASDGSLVRVINAKKYHFDYPSAITLGDSHLWIASGGNAKHNASVVELNPKNGSLVRVINSKGISTPSGIATDGPDVWVTNSVNNTVAEFAASSGSLIRLINAPSYHIDNPLQIEVAGGKLWVSNAEGSFPMTEIDGATGSLVRTIEVTGAWLANPKNESTGTAPGGFVVDAADLCIANNANIVEINANNGSLVRVISVNADNFDFTRNVAADGVHVWASNFLSNSVTELDASNGTMERLIP